MAHVFVFSSKFISTEEADANFLFEHEWGLSGSPKTLVAGTEAVAPPLAARRAAGGGGVAASRRQTANKS